MIIAIDGPQHSGKTTCLNSLRARDSLASAVCFVDEVARTIAPSFGVAESADWDRILRDPGRLDAFFDAEFDQLQDEETPPAVVDGSALLVTAYKRTFLDPMAVPKFAPRYDLIFLCEPWGVAKSDGFRFVRGQAEVLAHYRKLVMEFELSTRVVELPATPERLQLLHAHPVWADLVGTRQQRN